MKITLNIILTFILKNNIFNMPQRYTPISGITMSDNDYQQIKLDYIIKLLDGDDDLLQDAISYIRKKKSKKLLNNLY